MIWAVMEAAKGMLYRLTWHADPQERHRLQLNHTSSQKSQQASQGGTLANPSRFSEQDNKQNL
jgi:hypothetical protein